MYRTIGFCAPAGTGKSSLANALKAKLGDKVEVVQSVSRETYAKFGYSGEDINLKLTLDEKFQLQSAIFSAWVRRYVDVVQKYIPPDDTTYLVFERTLFDNAAYLYTHAEGYDLNVLNQYRESAINIVNDFDYVITFPYPPPFAGQVDNFRWVDSEKDTKHQGYLNQFLREFTPKNPVLSLEGVVSVEDRVNFVINNCFK